MKVCLDLFCGLGGFSAAFADADDWHVVTVDIEARFDPDLQADVLDLRPADLLDALPVDEWDDMDTLVVLASPPCTQFSLAASRYERIVDGEPQTDDARDAVALAFHTMGLVRACSPDYWWIENPQGYLRQFLGTPDARVTFCQYGTGYMKPTDLWGSFPPSWHPRSCNYGDECHAYNTDQEHGGLGNCAVMDDDKNRTSFQQQTSGSKSEARALIPHDLSQSILDAVENPEAGTILSDEWGADA